jgi:hypothetical protein
MHGTIMLLLFATPLFAGFANAIMPLQIGAPDVAFPRLNMLSYWLYLFGGLIVLAGFFTPAGAASFGWFAYAPLSNAVFSPGLGGDLWVFGLAMAGGILLASLSLSFTRMTEDSQVIPATQQQQIAAALETDAEVMSNTELDKRITGQPPNIEQEILAINDDARNRSLQVALLVPLLAALGGLANSFRMVRLPDVKPAAPLEGLDLG